MNMAERGALLKIHPEKGRKEADEDLGDGVEGWWLEARPQRYATTSEPRNSEVHVPRLETHTYVLLRNISETFSYLRPTCH